MKKIIGILSASIALTLLLSACVVIQMNQIVKPLDTNYEFDICQLSQEVTSTEVFSLLEEISDKCGANIYKVTALCADENEEVRNIIVIGTQEINSQNPSIDNGKINWLAKGVQGQVLGPDSAERSVAYGRYYSTYSPELEAELQRLSYDYDIDVIANRSGLSLSLIGLLNAHPYFFALLGLFIVNITLSLTYLIKRRKRRTIELLAGVSFKDMLLGDLSFWITQALKGFIPGAIIGICALTYYYGLNNLQIIALKSLKLTGIYVLVFLLVFIALDYFERPKISYIALRKSARTLIPISILKFITIFILGFTLPIAIDCMCDSLNLAGDIQLWKSLGGVSSVHIRDTPGMSLEDEAYEEQYKGFVESQSIRDNILLSYVYPISPEEFKGSTNQTEFDYMVLVNRQWVDKINQSMTDEKPRLEEIDLEREYPDVFNEVKGSMELMIYGPSDIDGIDGYCKFYKPKSGEYLSIVGDPGMSESLDFVDNPLIVEINDATSLYIDNFVALMSSGNICFNDIDVLKLGVQDNNINQFILAINSIADLSLTNSQTQSLYAIGFGISTFILGLAVVMAFHLGVSVWISLRQQKIFIEHLQGKSFIALGGPFLIGDLIITAILLGVAVIYPIPITGMDLVLALKIYVAIVGLYLLITQIDYQYLTGKSFKNQILRRNY